MLVFDGSATYDASYNGFTPSKNSALELIQKLRTGDRVGIVQLPNTLKLGLTTIQDDNTRTSVSNIINGLTVGGTSAIGQGLQTAQSAYSMSPSGNSKAVILLSAGDEAGIPNALTLAPSLRSGGIHLYTVGFAGSPSGQNLDSRLADTTGGKYYLTSDALLYQSVRQMWNTISGTQNILEAAFPSNAAAWQGAKPGQGAGAWQGAAAWQGAVDPGTTELLPAAAWQGSTFYLGLKRPDGQYIDQTNYSNYAGVQLESGATYTFFKVPNPMPGTWTFLVVGANTVPQPPTPETLLLTVGAKADVTMSVTFDKTVYTPGSTVEVHAVLSAGGQSPGGEHTSGGSAITNATVGANITLPDGTTQTITLSHIGNGVYTGTFNQTATPGSYIFVVNASGVLAESGQPYTRQSQQSVFVPAPIVPNASLFAVYSITLQDSSGVVSGSVIVNNTSSSTYQLTVGKGVITPPQYNLKASKISIGAGSVIGGDVYYNQLTNAGSIGGAVHTPLTLPVVASLPPFQSATVGTSDITVAAGTQANLNPGKYRNLTVQSGATLTMAGGTYNFNRITIKSRARLAFGAASTVRVVGQVYADTSTFIGPAQGSGIDAPGIVFYVAGSDDHDFDNDESVIIGPSANVSANFYTSNGSLWLKKSTTARGAFLAKYELIEKKVTVTLASAFTGLLKQDELAEQAATLPEAFGLDQNYPNPFNPTTVIRYQLPQNRNVLLKVFDILGQEVKVLVNEAQQAGSYQIQWDGTNATGARVSSGVYFYRIQAGDFVNTKKMLLLK
jgi:hypothetical protein